MNKKSRAAALEKVPTGLGPLDHSTGGGLPTGRVTLISGPPGSGKTIFCLQALVQGCRRADTGVFVSFNQSPGQIIEDAASLGWDLASLEKDKLVLLDGRPQLGGPDGDSFDFTGLLGGVRAVSSEIAAKFVVFDSIDVMMGLLGGGPGALHELFRLRDWICENKLTALFTVNAGDASDPQPAHREWLQAASDCSIALDLQRTANLASRFLRVEKYRGSAFEPQELPFRVGISGFEFVTSKPSPMAIPETQGMARLNEEIELAKRQLTERIQNLNHFLEIKQAELGFRLENHPGAAARGMASRRKQAGRASERRTEKG